MRFPWRITQIIERRNQNNVKRILTKDGVRGVHGDLVLSSVPDQTLRVGERHIRRRRPVPLVIGDNLDSVMLPDSDAGVRRPQIDTDRWSLSFSGHYQNSSKEKENEVICFDNEEKEK